MVEDLRPIWNAATKSSANWDTPMAWQRLLARRNARARRLPLELTHSERPRPKAPVFRIATRRWTSLASVTAAAVFVAGASLLLWRVRGEEPVQEAAHDTQTVTVREIRTAPGQLSVLTLRDGTRLTLAPASVLRYDTSRYGADSRDVELDGEAFITVAHDSRLPFTVRTKRGIVQAIGTAFDVSVFDGEALRVVVAEGRVALHASATRKAGERIDAGQGTMLVKGDRARVGTSGTVRVEHGVNVARLIGWTAGRLAFDGTPLREVIPVLERWYDLEIRLTDPALADRRLTATFATEPVSQFLNRVALALDLHVSRDGRFVALSARQ